MRVAVHAPGPAGHGVVRHAHDVAALVAAQPGITPTGPVTLTHAQFTDALFGPDIATAAAAFTTWAHTATRPLVVTVHDVPGSDPDPARDARRGAGYAAVTAAADAVVVSAAHEAAAVTALTGVTPTVIALPIPTPPRPGPRPAWADHPTLVVLGFVHPGKGHRDAIAAAAAQLRPPLVVAAGEPVPGHGSHLGDLQAAAKASGVRWQVTGWLSDADLAAAAAAATVPMAPARPVSASGSTAWWLACGRRPVTAHGAYIAELAERHPGALARYRDDRERDALVAAALADPAATRTAAVTDPRDIGAAHVALYRSVLHRWRRC